MIRYVTGDATRPEGAGAKVIAHVCNDRGVWGRGFVLAISERWLEPGDCYRSAPNYVLGTNQVIQVEPDIQIVNMICQRGLPKRGGGSPLSYLDLRECLIDVARIAKDRSASVHVPRIGAGLARGHWPTIENYLSACLVEEDGLDVTVYDLPKNHD
jgi:O-acetyl-ADP-ribose deacetylase (regulator of RNase III)